MRAYWRLAGDYWKGPTAVQAWSLTGISLVLVVGNIVVQYGINVWNRAFFNALEQRDPAFTYRAIVLFLILAFLAASVARGNRGTRRRTITSTRIPSVP